MPKTAVYQNDNCSKGQLLKIIIAQNNNCSKQQLLKMTIAQKNICSKRQLLEWQLLKKTIPQNNNSSKQQLLKTFAQNDNCSKLQYSAQKKACQWKILVAVTLLVLVLTLLAFFRQFWLTRALKVAKTFFYCIIIRHLYI